MTWGFMLVVFMALFGFAVVIGVMVMVFRAATQPSGRPPGDGSKSFVPPVLCDDTLTNPANPLYHIHHPSPSGHDASSHYSPSSFESGSTSSSSFDSGSSSSSTSSDGSGCG